MSNYIFNEEDFLHFGIVATEATMEAIAARCRRECLLKHPDKPGGSHEAFIDMHDRYDRLRIQFDLFKLLLGEKPDMTIASVTRPAHTGKGKASAVQPASKDRGKGSAAQPPSSGAFLLARSYHVHDIIEANPVLVSSCLYQFVLNELIL